MMGVGQRKEVRPGERRGSEGGGRSGWEVRRSEGAIGVTQVAAEGSMSLGSRGSDEERKRCRSERGGLVLGSGVCKGQRQGSEDRGPVEDGLRGVGREGAKSMWV